ncbi:MAG TPA: nuclear transport factor 2 family protein [Pseudonocardiaceae bacterium]|nr:nuclear transport factor 2 family protein [Pseudonocardiaceae bacterium]
MTGTAETINAFFTRFGAGDRAGMLELFAEDADFLVAGADNVPWTGRREGHAQIATFIDSVCDDVETKQFDVDTIVTDGENGVVLGSFAHLVLRTGKIFTGPFALHIGVRDGKIRTYHMYEDSYAASVAFTD